MTTAPKSDPAEMSYEEFVAMIKDSEAQYQNGNYVSFDSVEELDEHIRNMSEKPAEMSYEEFVAMVKESKMTPVPRCSLAKTLPHSLNAEGMTYNNITE